MYLLNYFMSNSSLTMCVYVCMSVQPFEKINATGVASVEPGKAREWIGIANLCQMKFRQMIFHQMKFCQKKKFRQKCKKKKFRQKRTKKSFGKNVKKKGFLKKENK